MYTSKLIEEKESWLASLYDKLIIERMYLNDLSLREAVEQDMEESGVDMESVFDMTDYLEAMFDLDMDKVGLYMAILSGHHPDMCLKELNDGKGRKNRRS